jgi:hypothetical protein
MVKKRSSREVIGSVSKPHIEESWLKFPNEELQVNSLKRRAGCVKRDDVGSAKKSRARYDSGHLEYRGTGVHTHPYIHHRFGEEFYKRLGQIPSPEDLKNLLVSTHLKTEVIAQTDARTGEVLSYTVLRKTKQTPHWEFTKVSNIENPIKKFLFHIGMYMPDQNKTGVSDYSILEYKQSLVKTGLSGDLNYFVDGFKKFAEKTHLQYKFIPVKRKDSEDKEPTKKGLENSLVTTSILSLIAGVFFSSTKITGNVIGYSTETSSLIGAGFSIVGLIVGFIWLKNKK